MSISHSDKVALALVKRYEAMPDAYYEAEEYDIICEHYMRMAQLNKTLKASRQGLVFHKHYCPLYYHLAKTYMELNQLDAAKDTIQAALRLHKSIIEQVTKKLSTDFYLQMYDTYMLKAEICLKRKELGGATKAMNLAIKLPVKFSYSP